MVNLKVPNMGSAKLTASEKKRTSGLSPRPDISDTIGQKVQKLKDL